MQYTDFLKDLESNSTDSVSYFLSLKTKNVHGIDHLVDKGYLPAILKRLEIAAKGNEKDRIDILKQKGMDVIPVEYLPELKINMESIVKEHLPVLLKTSKMSIS